MLRHGSDTALPDDAQKLKDLIKSRKGAWIHIVFT
jgi:hypothetical protein